MKSDDKTLIDKLKDVVPTISHNDMAFIVDNSGYSDGLSDKYDDGDEQHHYSREEVIQFLLNNVTYLDPNGEYADYYDQYKIDGYDAFSVEVSDGGSRLGANLKSVVSEFSNMNTDGVKTFMEYD
jgi:hypothetical protein